MPTEGYTVHQRLVPQEPAYVIFNVAMSNSFGYVDLQKLPFPSEMKVPLDLQCTLYSTCAASLCTAACFTADSRRWGFYGAIITTFVALLLFGTP